MKIPPVLFFLLSIILLAFPVQWLNKLEHAVLAVTKPLVYLHSKTPSITAEAEYDPRIIESLKPKDKIKFLEQRILELNDTITLLKNENTSLINKIKSISDFRTTIPSALNIKEHYDIIVSDVVIKSDASVWRRSIIINKGENDGLKSGLTVVWGKYLVGKISDVGAFTSRIQLITDPAFRAQVLIMPCADTRVSDDVSRMPFGVLAGISFDSAIVKWVSREYKVQNGWEVYSAPDPNALIPKGLIIGKVNNISPDGFFYNLSITPAIDFYNLNDVLILRPKIK
jgi:rod shape-determining protein MreC